MRLQAVDVRLGYGDRVVVDGLDLGIEAGTGTDKVAGRSARFFMSGTSEHMIRFIK